MDLFSVMIYHMQNPKVTILLATYNRSRFLDATMESIVGQSVRDWELIVADDGSTDDTPKVVREWQEKEPRIVYVRNAVNQGISKNYNQGLRLAKGEYIAMIDDDDPWIGGDKLKRQIAFLDAHPDHVGCGGGVVVVDAERKELYRYLKPATDAQIRARMLFSNPMANSTTLFRRSAGEKVGWYDESIRYSGDRDFWLKMGLVGKLYNFPEYFSYYTMSGTNTSVAKIRPHLKTSLTVMRRYKGKYPGYIPALLMNKLQYWYSLLPASLRSVIHYPLARIKRRIAG